MMRYELLFLLLVAVVPAGCYDNNPLDPALNWYEPFDLLQINMSAAVTGVDYTVVMLDVISKVVAGSTNDLYGTAVLARQAVNQPPYRWLMVDLIGSGDARTMLAIRQDNIYVSAVTDKSGAWFVFSNVAALNIVPVGTTLPFSNDYSGLVGPDGHKALGSLVLGREATLQAVDLLANCQQASNTDIARAVAVLVVTLTEAARFREVQIHIATNWESGVQLGDLKYLVVKWKTISCSLMLAKQNSDVWEGSTEATQLANPPQDTGAAISNKQQASDAILVALWPWKDKCSKKVKWLN